MSQFHFHPDEYLDLMHAEVSVFDELQDQVASATLGIGATRILELGTGTGETARRVLSKHPGARLTGIDVSEEMLGAARQALPSDLIDGLLVRGMEDPLPEGPFDLVAHHPPPGCDGQSRSLSKDGWVVRNGGRFVMGDVVVPKDPADAIIPLTPDYDLPSSVDELTTWLRNAGFQPHLHWSSRDLAVITSDLP